MAVAQRRPDAVIHHSDQGCQYTSLAFGARCQEWDVALSMGSVGDCFDNAMAESFFATLECELLARTTLSTHAEARAAVFEFVEGWYNTRRRHSRVGLSGAAGVRTSSCRRPCGRCPVCGRLSGAHESVGARLAGADSRRHRRSSGNTRGGMMTNRRTARLRLRKPDSCCETCRLVEETNTGLLGRRASLGPRWLPKRSPHYRTAQRIPTGRCGSAGLWTPGRVVLNLKVGEAGAHSPLEISRAIAADHACAGAARFPHFHSASSSSILTRKPRSSRTCHDVNPKA